MAQVLANKGDGTYTFANQQGSSGPQRKKYKDQYMTQNQQEQLVHYGNIMYDRRVIRGNTYALHTLPATAQPDPIAVQKEQEERKRALARRRAREQARRHTPEPVEGRKHIPIQTELYLEELSDRVEEVDVDVQTDAFLDRPPSPLFVPAKTGVDQATQIYEGDLFDFDLEVKPILEVLVGKTIEQSLLEVMEEEELADLRKQQREFEELRNAEKVEQQRLEEQERRLREEKHRRMKQAADVLRLEKETAEKLAAKAFAKSYLADLVPSVYNNLRENGYFYDPVERDVETGFMPWLMQDTVDELERQGLARRMLDHLIREVVAKRHDEYERLAEALKMQEQEEQQGDQMLTLNRDESILIGEEGAANAAAANPDEAANEAGASDAQAANEGEDPVEASNQFDEEKNDNVDENTTD